MKLIVDEERFDSLQAHLVAEIVASIRDGLLEAGIKDDQVLYEATGNIAFSVAAIVDGSRIMELDGREVVPVLTFSDERNGDNLISAETGGSWLHEYVFGTVDEVFAAEDEEPPESEG